MRYVRSRALQKSTILCAFALVGGLVPVTAAWAGRASDEVERRLQSRAPAFSRDDSCQRFGRRFVPPTFASVEDLRAATTSRNILGVMIPNPICTLREIGRTSLTEPVSQASPEPSSMFRSVLMAERRYCANGAGASARRACELPRLYDAYRDHLRALDPAGVNPGVRLVHDWTPIDFRAGNFALVEQFHLAGDPTERVTDLLLLQVSMERALMTKSRVARRLAHQSETMMNQMGLAATELWLGHPAQAFRAYFNGLDCETPGSPTTLDACGVAKDVLALTLDAALRESEDVLGAVERDLARVGRVDVNKAVARIELVRAVANHLEVARTDAGRGLGIDELKQTDNARTLESKIKQLAKLDLDTAAVPAYRSIVDLFALEGLRRDLDAYHPLAAPIGEAQFSLNRYSYGSRGVTENLRDQGNRLRALISNLIKSEDHPYATQ